MVWANQPIHWHLGGKVATIRQEPMYELVCPPPKVPSELKCQHGVQTCIFPNKLITVHVTYNTNKLKWNKVQLKHMCYGMSKCELGLLNIKRDNANPLGVL